ncbi:MAG TPA: DUF1957 domain-containing protein [Limnochordia bacterium]|nr:DUF1957 domain-containing protein [Limnochordia bacterium]HXK96540.1 DUF1957 domain-containing protein [Limnochordia bacterium]
MTEARGILAIILHAHLPYVRHPERERTLEELWLFEAITETYLPLLAMFDRIVKDQVPCRITMSITPTLGSMLQDPLLVERYISHLGRMIELAEKELERTRFQPEFYPLAQMYHEMFVNGLDAFVGKYGGNLVAAFAKLQEQGVLEIIASAATHGYLPLMDRSTAVDAQINVGVSWYREQFHRDPEGFWLPECGYTPGIDQILRKYGIQYTILDTHGVMHSRPKPRYAMFAPILSPSGVACFGRDLESSKQVWSSTEGYPGDYNYRDFYRDIGYDLDYDYVRPYLYSDHRGHTGIKYYKITGKTDDKQPYCPKAALETAAVHAGNFMFNREKQVEYLCLHMDREPIIVAPYDAELFGHWWFEGPQWLEYLIRKVAFDQQTIKLGTPGEYLKRYPVNQVAQPSMSSWGFNGYSEVWLDDANDWIYRHLSMIAKTMGELANAETGDDLIRRALNQAAREVLLAQSSDWAFIMKAGTMTEYAVMRTCQHIQRFWQLEQQIRSGRVDQHYLSEVEGMDNIFPNLDYRVFRQTTAAEIMAQIS